MLGSLWARITKPRRAAEELEMSSDEREFFEEPVEGHAADEVSETHLGGFDPERLVDDD